MGKGRPKFSRQGAFVKTYTPAKTANYETLVRLTYQQEGGALHESPVRMRIDAYYSIPQSASRKKHTAMLTHEVLPTKKPDADNVAKIICDSLNGVAYRDDTQVVDLTVRKFYGDVPQTVVEIEDYGGSKDEKAD